MGRITALVASLAMLLVPSAGRADAPAGGAVVNSPKALVGYFSRSPYEYRIVAYQNGPTDLFSGVHVVASRYDASTGTVDQRDEEIVSANALTLSESGATMTMTLDADLPNTGTWKLTVSSQVGNGLHYLSPPRFSLTVTRGGQAGGLAYPGTIGGTAIPRADCAWGSGATGSYLSD